MGDGKVRRVVKGFDNEGRSTIVSDGASPAIKSIPGCPDYYSTNVRRTGAAPVDITEPDLIEGHVGVSPPANGTVLRVIDFLPNRKIRKNAHASLQPHSEKSSTMRIRRMAVISIRACTRPVPSTMQSF